MLRATSKQMEEELHAYPMIVRSHRAFIVNLGQVEQIVSKPFFVTLRLQREFTRHSEEKTNEFVLFFSRFFVTLHPKL